MNRPATIFLVVAALVIGTLAVVFLPLGTGGGKAVGSALFDFDPDDISLVKITNGDDVLELRRTENGWFIGPEPKDRASVDAVRRLIQTALATPVLDRIDAREIDGRDELSLYGLKKSRVQIDFRGDRDLSLLIGKDAVDESRAYVRFEDSRDIYLVPDDLVNLILSSPQDFRDRMPARLRPDRIDRILVSRPGGEIELKRQGTGWRIIKPLAAAASESAIENFLKQVLKVRIEGFEESADPGVMGLSEPGVELQLFGEGESTPETIRLGTAAVQGGVYARLEPRGVTVRLSRSIAELLGFDLAALRDNTLARINLDLVDKIRVTSPSGSFTLQRKGDSWMSGDKRVSAAAIQRMVDSFALAQSAGFQPATGGVIQQTGLSQPAVSVEFFSVVSENTPETAAGDQLVAGLQFGTKQASGLIPVLASGSPEISFVPETVLEAVPTQESAWLLP